MKLRATFSVLAIAAAVSACSSSSSGGGTPTGGGSTGGGVTVTTPAASGASAGAASGDFCAKLQSSTTKLGNLGTTASGGDLSAVKDVISQEVAAFQDLGNGAPADVKPTIDDIVTSLQAAESALADPTHPDLAKLQALSTKVPADVTKLTTYVTSNCS
jgi:hypothetical protein